LYSERNRGFTCVYRPICPSTYLSVDSNPPPPHNVWSCAQKTKLHESADPTVMCSIQAFALRFNENKSFLINSLSLSLSPSLSLSRHPCSRSCTLQPQAEAGRRSSEVRTFRMCSGVPALLRCGRPPSATSVLCLWGPPTPSLNPEH